MTFKKALFTVWLFRAVMWSIVGGGRDEPSVSNQSDARDLTTDTHFLSYLRSHQANTKLSHFRASGVWRRKRSGYVAQIVAKRNAAKRNAGETERGRDGMRAKRNVGQTGRHAMRANRNRAGPQARQRLGRGSSPCSSMYSTMCLTSRGTPCPGCPHCCTSSRGTPKTRPAPRGSPGAGDRLFLMASAARTASFGLRGRGGHRARGRGGTEHRVRRTAESDSQIS